MTTGTILLVSAALAFLLGTILPLLRRWRRRRHARAYPPAPDRPIAIVLPPPPPPRRPPVPQVTPPLAPPPHRGGLRLTPAEARRAIVLATVLGPCRGTAPYH